MSTTASGKRTKRARQFLTPEAKRTFIAVALQGAGHPSFIAWPVARAVFEMPTNGLRNQEAMARAIAAQILGEHAKRAAWGARIWPEDPPVTQLRLVYSAETDR